MDDATAFEVFFADTEPLVRRALVSRFGAEIGRDATAEGFTVAWRSWPRVSSMQNRSGYVYRVGQRWASRHRSRADLFAGQPSHIEDRYCDLELGDALSKLSPRQRQAVVLVCGFALTHQEAADLLGCRRSTIQNHVERGMKRLRTNMEAKDHAG